MMMMMMTTMTTGVTAYSVDCLLLALQAQKKALYSNPSPTKTIFQTLVLSKNKK
jgi:hypothetical protein